MEDTNREAKAGSEEQAAEQTARHGIGMHRGIEKPTGGPQQASFDCGALAGFVDLGR